jgi:hypothetical protein
MDSYLVSTLHIFKENVMIFSILLACGEETPTSSVDNPTGECVSDTDGSRQCYHAPSNTDTYLKNCDASLEREYWRVFAQDDGSAYIIPRPDGMGLVYNLCEDPDVGSIFEIYALCEEILGSSSVEIINNIPPEDAMVIAQKLHDSLEFAVDIDNKISPWAPPNDIVDVCYMSDSDDGVLSTFCDTALGYYDSENDCPNIIFEPSPEEALIITRRLNILYGVSL